MIRSKNIKYDVRIVDPKTREGQVGQIYAQSQRDLLAVPEPVTVTLHSPATSPEAPKMPSRPPYPISVNALGAWKLIQVDLAWAATSPSVAGAFTRFASVTEQTGQQVLSPAVRELICGYAQMWVGEWPSLSRGWVEDVIRSHHLAEGDKAAARLALLALRAPYQIDEGVISVRAC